MNEEFHDPDIMGPEEEAACHELEKKLDRQKRERNMTTDTLRGSDREEGETKMS